MSAWALFWLVMCLLLGAHVKYLLIRRSEHHARKLWLLDRRVHVLEVVQGRQVRDLQFTVGLIQAEAERHGWEWRDADRKKGPGGCDCAVCGPDGDHVVCAACCPYRESQP